MWWTVATVIGWIVLAVLVGLALTRFLAQFGFEYDPATGERSLSRSSSLGKYYNFLCFGGGYYDHKRWWNYGRDLDVCTVGSRVFWRTLLLLVGVVVALMLLVGFFTVPYCIYEYGWVVLEKITVVSGLWMQTMLIIGMLTWILVGLLLASVSLAFAVEALAEWNDGRLYRKRAAAQTESAIQQESLFTAWRRSVKDRVCYRVKVVK